MQSYSIRIREGFLNNELHVLNADAEWMWHLKSHDSLVRKAVNFNLLIKLPSIYCIYAQNKLRYRYVKKGKNKRAVIDCEQSVTCIIERVTASSDLCFRWGEGEYELTSLYNTTVHIKRNNECIGEVSSDTSFAWNETIDKISIQIEDAYEAEIPIILLVYINEFYQHGIG